VSKFSLDERGWEIETVILDGADDDKYGAVIHHQEAWMPKV